MIHKLNHLTILNPCEERKSDSTCKKCPDVPDTEPSSRQNVEIYQDVNIKSEMGKRLLTAAEAGMAVVQGFSDVILESPVKSSLTGLAKAGIAAGGVYFAVRGAVDLKDAIKKRSLIGGIGASGTLALAGDAAIYTAMNLAQNPSVAKVMGPSAVACINSPAVAALSTSLGFVFAGSELISGINLLHKGHKYKDSFRLMLGALNVGIGVTAALFYGCGGTVPAAILSGLCAAEIVALGVKEIDRVMRSR